MSDPNVKHDARHLLGRSVAAPASVDSELHLVRCLGCHRLATEHELAIYGMCPRCDGHRFNGAYPRVGWEMFRIQFLNLTQNWRVHGRRGWGWARAFKRIRQQNC